MLRCRKTTIFSCLIFVILSAPVAFATNGYFGHGYSTAEKGLAGAGVAHSFDALASATNPAGLVSVGRRFDIGMALFSPQRQYTVSGMPSGGSGTFPLAPGTYESDNSLFVIPHLAFNTMINPTTALGVAVYGNGGMNSSYSAASVNNGPGNPAGTFGGGTAGVNLEQLFVNLSLAKMVSERHAFGVSAIFAYQKFAAEGLGAFGAMGFSADPKNLTNNGDDNSTGFGLKIGWQGEVVQDVLTMGAAYQTKMSMNPFDKYAGLFAEGGDFDIPATATLGLAWKTGESSTVVFDVQKIYYEDVSSISNSVENLFAVPGGAMENRLGGSNGAGFGWKNMTVFKLAPHTLLIVVAPTLCGKPLRMAN